MINFLKKKKTLLIFDGIDEVPCKHDIIKFLKIDEVFPDFTYSRRIFTCRKEELTKS
jgi:predicted NACHT family NTPase